MLGLLGQLLERRHASSSKGMIHQVWLRVWIASVVLAGGLLCSAGPSPESTTGWCVITRNTTVNKTRLEQVPYEVEVWNKCIGPPSCLKPGVEIREENVTRVEHEIVNDTVCCDGFRISLDGKMCHPVCEPSCDNGQCIGPNKCECPKGLAGPLCERHCDDGKLGAVCDDRCPCKDEAFCDPVDATCHCKPGWMGTDCSAPCPANKFGKDCILTCLCSNGAACDPVTGRCTCPPGYQGPACLAACDPGTYGDGCSKKCRCQNGAECDPVTGVCSCTDSWTGEDCSQRVCPEGYFGVNCSQWCRCNRRNTVDCHPVTGRCACKPGWFDDTCERSCPQGRYGRDCAKTCDCASLCDPKNGECLCERGFAGKHCNETCTRGWFGPSCNSECKCKGQADCCKMTGRCFCGNGTYGVQCQLKCPPGTHGPNCAYTCACEHGNDCDPVSGTCLCNPGYRGERCEQKCPDGLYGVKCQHKCNCGNATTNDGCDHATGICQCKNDWLGAHCETRCKDYAFWGEHCNKTCLCQHGGHCEQMSGRCACPRGLTGDRCQSRCPYEKFGFDCESDCPPCNNTANKLRRCNSVSGRCECLAGWSGTLCDKSCPMGTFGERCAKLCMCSGHGDCHPRTGECSCRSGWMGDACEHACPAGLFGVDCLQLCKCPNVAACRHTDGECLCKPGWTGSRCSHTCEIGRWGDRCEHLCSCRDGIEVCLPAEGCSCQTRGEDTLCTELSGRIAANVSWEPDSTDNDSETWYDYHPIATSVAVLLLCIVGICVFRRCVHRTNRRVKREVFHVGFHKDDGASSSPSQGLDNPMYDVRAMVNSAHSDNVCTLKKQTERSTSMSVLLDDEVEQIKSSTGKNIPIDFVFSGEAPYADRGHQPAVNELNDLDSLSNDYQDIDEMKMMNNDPIYCEPTSMIFTGQFGETNERRDTLLGTAEVHVETLFNKPSTTNPFLSTFVPTGGHEGPLNPTPTLPPLPSRNPQCSVGGGVRCSKQAKSTNRPMEYDHLERHPARTDLHPSYERKASLLNKNKGSGRKQR